MLPFMNLPGVYLIHCTANDATYTGSSQHVLMRLQAHIVTLRAGTSKLDYLQADWDKFGESAFNIFVRYYPINELWHREEELTLLAHSLVDHGGYNKMVANREWSLSSRAKNTELKLHKQGKFTYLPGVDATQRLSGLYLSTFCQSDITLYNANPKLQPRLDRVAAQTALAIELESYQQFPPTQN